jgi:hypothetical protein
MNGLAPVWWVVGIAIFCTMVAIGAESSWTPECEVQRYAQLSDLVKRKGKDEEKQLLADLLLKLPSCTKIPADVWPLYEMKTEPPFKPVDGLVKRPSLALLESQVPIKKQPNDILGEWQFKS